MFRQEQEELPSHIIETKKRELKPYKLRPAHDQALAVAMNIYGRRSVVAVVRQLEIARTRRRLELDFDTGAV